MTAPLPDRVRAGRLARGAWIAIALAPIGWASGIALAFLAGEGQADGVGPLAVGLLGIVVFVAAPAAATVLAVQATRAGHRSGKIATVVSASLLVATLLLTLLLGRIGLIVVAAAVTMVVVGSRVGKNPKPAG